MTIFVHSDEGKTSAWRSIFGMFGIWALVMHGLFWALDPMHSVALIRFGYCCFLIPRILKFIQRIL